MLLAAGLRETHRIADLGCGLLRVGRLLIPYLLPGRYYGMEPNTLSQTGTTGIVHTVGSACTQGFL